MKILKSNSKILSVIETAMLLIIFFGIICGATISGQQSPDEKVFWVAFIGGFKGLIFSSIVIGCFIYPVISITTHLIWCLCTHDRKYHWLIRMIAGARCQFKELRFTVFS